MLIGKCVLLNQYGLLDMVLRTYMVAFIVTLFALSVDAIAGRSNDQITRDGVFDAVHEVYKADVGSI